LIEDPHREMRVFFCLLFKLLLIEPRQGGVRHANEPSACGSWQRRKALP
jgi:hypothetical protein